MASRTSKPCVSICIPTYNNPNGLSRALDSIVKQSYGDYETIVTDDSTDKRVYEVCKQFSGKVKSLKYYKNKTQLGSPGNWNEGIKRASGQYIKILHHDDWFTDSDALALFVEQAINNGGEFVFCASSAINPKGKRIGLNQPNARTIGGFIKNPDLLLDRNLIGAPSATLFKRSKSHFFDKKLIWLVDVDFYISLIRKGNKVKYISRPLIATAQQTATQLTTQVQNSKSIEIYEQMYAYEKHYKNVYFKPVHIRKINSILSKYQVYSYIDLQDVTLTPWSRRTLLPMITARFVYKKIRQLFPINSKGSN